MAYGIGIEEHDHEGRVITAEFSDYYVVTCYTPNSKDGLARLPYRMVWEDAFLRYLKGLEEKKPVIFCGDLNVAHKEIDLKNPKTNRKNAGFTDEERGKFTDLLDAGFIDTFRWFYPDREEIYSWWSYRFSARSKNAGWRIDYFCVAEALKDRLVSADIHTEVLGSDQDVYKRQPVHRGGQTGGVGICNSYHGLHNGDCRRSGAGTVSKTADHSARFPFYGNRGDCGGNIANALWRLVY